MHLENLKNISKVSNDTINFNTKVIDIDFYNVTNRNLFLGHKGDNYLYAIHLIIPNLEDIDSSEGGDNSSLSVRMAYQSKDMEKARTINGVKSDGQYYFLIPNTITSKVGSGFIQFEISKISEKNEAVPETENDSGTNESSTESSIKVVIAKSKRIPYIIEESLEIGSEDEEIIEESSSKIEDIFSLLSTLSSVKADKDEVYTTTVANSKFEVKKNKKSAITENPRSDDNTNYPSIEAVRDYISGQVSKLNTSISNISGNVATLGLSKADKSNVYTKTMADERFELVDHKQKEIFETTQSNKDAYPSTDAIKKYVKSNINKNFNISGKNLLDYSFSNATYDDTKSSGLNIDIGNNDPNLITISGTRDDIFNRWFVVNFIVPISLKSNHSYYLLYKKPEGEEENFTGNIYFLGKTNPENMSDSLVFFRNYNNQNSYTPPEDVEIRSMGFYVGNKSYPVSSETTVDGQARFYLMLTEDNTLEKYEPPIKEIKEDLLPSGIKNEELLQENKKNLLTLPNLNRESTIQNDSAYVSTYFMINDNHVEVKRENATSTIANTVINLTPSIKLNKGFSYTASLQNDEYKNNYTCSVFLYESNNGGTPIFTLREGSAVESSLFCEEDIEVNKIIIAAPATTKVTELVSGDLIDSSFYIQLEEGEKATTYESEPSYTIKKEYLSNLLEEKEVLTTQKRNLLNFPDKTFTNRGITYKANKNIFTVSGYNNDAEDKASVTTFFLKEEITLEKDKTYYFSIWAPETPETPEAASIWNSSSINATIFFEDNDTDNNKTIIFRNNPNATRTRFTPKTSQFIKCIQFNIPKRQGPIKGSTNTQQKVTFYLQLEENETNNEYVPFATENKVLKEELLPFSSRKGMNYIYVSKDYNNNIEGFNKIYFNSIIDANNSIIDNSKEKPYTIIVKSGTTAVPKEYDEFKTRFNISTDTSSLQGILTKDYVYYESETPDNPAACVLQWDGADGDENFSDERAKKRCIFHIPNDSQGMHTHIKGFTMQSKNTRYGIHMESGGYGRNREWLVEDCIIEYGGRPATKSNTPIIGIGMSPHEKGTIRKVTVSTYNTTLNNGEIYKPSERALNCHDNYETTKYTGVSAIKAGAELTIENCNFNNHNIGLNKGDVTTNAPVSDTPFNINLINNINISEINIESGNWVKNLKSNDSYVPSNNLFVLNAEEITVEKKVTEDILTDPICTLNDGLIKISTNKTFENGDNERKRAIIKLKEPFVFERDVSYNIHIYNSVRNDFIIKQYNGNPNPKISFYYDNAMKVEGINGDFEQQFTEETTINKIIIDFNFTEDFAKDSRYEIAIYLSIEKVKEEEEQVTNEKYLQPYEFIAKNTIYTKSEIDTLIANLKSELTNQ